MSYDQLRTIVYYIYTGVAILEEHMHVKYVDSHQADSGTGAAGSSTKIEEQTAQSVADGMNRPSKRVKNDADASTQDEDKDKDEEADPKQNEQWWETLQPTNVFDMYRLADKYDVAGLRKQALLHIAGSIYPKTIKAELENEKIILLSPELKKTYQSFLKIYHHGVRTRYPDCYKDIFKTLDFEDPGPPKNPYGY